MQSYLKKESNNIYKGCDDSLWFILLTGSFVVIASEIRRIDCFDEFI